MGWRLQQASIAAPIERKRVDQRRFSRIRGRDLEFLSVAAQSASPTWLTRIAGFALVSGVGLAIDFGMFLALVEFLDVRAGVANLVSAAIAVTFVYFVSVRRLFNYQGRFLLALFALYLAYQIIAVAAASWAIDWLALNLFAPMIAKAVILPVTFTANYLFMSFITRSRAAP
jgi:putative flippase GtrA